MQAWAGQDDKIQPRHRDRLAVVYVRQSTVQQVARHQESTRLQYGLKEHAQRLGWPEERVLVIDEDLGVSGASSAGREGFQRLLGEVALDHVGLILGLEMSRLARSCKDWYQLLELCALFQTLIGDLDGLYDPARYNDRLLLGLKGTMSEAELHILKQRMLQGKLAKARRGELCMPVPIGYVRRPSGEIALDPDEEARAVVRRIFEQFERRGTLYGVLRHLVDHDIRVGVRVRSGPDKGELEWRRPNRVTLSNLLHNPTYAGAYVFGRRPTDPRRKKAGRPATGRVVACPDQWQVCLKDRLPAYISWDQYERNVAQLAANRSRRESRTAIRRGPALLQGLVVCGRCGLRMGTRYYGRPPHAYYVCAQRHSDYGEPVCQSVRADPLDAEVVRLALDALAPSALEVSLRVSEDLERARAEREAQWRHRLERARYETERTARQYHTVEPENRLVARTLETAWEGRLRDLRTLEEDYERSCRDQPRTLTQSEREAIRSLACDLPALWHTATTTDAERKDVLRQVLDRVEVKVEGKTEWVEAVLDWAGGRRTYTRLRRPVASMDRMSNHPELCARIRKLAAEGCPARGIAERLNAEGWRPPKRARRYTADMVRRRLSRLGVTTARRPLARDRSELGADEWWVPDLARELGVPVEWLYDGLRRNRHLPLRARQLGGRYGRWILWADERERNRLRELRARGRWKAPPQRPGCPSKM